MMPYGGGTTIGGTKSNKSSDAMSLEYCTFRIPYEELNVKFRQGQKELERASASVAKAASLLTAKTAGSNEAVSQETLRKNFDFLLKHVKDARQTFERVCAREMDQSNKILERCERLVEEMDLTEEGNDPRDIERLERQKFGRIVVWHLLRCGYIQSARSIVEELEIENLVDVDVFEKIYEVERALNDRNTQPCLAWIEEHRSKLRRLGSRLEIVVRQQDVVELIEQSNIGEAIAYVRKNIVPIAKAKHSDDLKKIMGAIASTLEDSRIHNPELHAEDRWQQCAQFFIKETYRIYEIHGNTAFATLLQYGLSSIKTPSCGPDHETPLDKQKCIVCRPDVWPIAENLPYSHVANSRILCSMTGELCDDDENTPYLFPSGHVFGKKTLEKLRRPDRKIYDPVNKQLIEECDALRLYFL